MTSQPVSGNGLVAFVMVLLFFVAIGAANAVIDAVAWAFGR